MKLSDLELKYKEQLIEIDEWVYLRSALGTYLLNKHGNKANNISIYQKLRYIVKQFFSMFYGFKSWFKSYNYLVFTDSAERRLVNGRYIDKISDDIVRKVGKDKTLMIELPNPKHYHIDTIVTHNIVSELPFKFMEKFLVYTMFYKKNYIKEIENILEKEGITFNYKKFIKSFHANYLIYKLFLRLYKPKVIFVNCYYCRFALIYAANELKIKVVELQHGVINKEHFAYNSSLKLNQKYMPNILLSFGVNESLLKNRLIDNIFPIGSFYLEYVEKNFLFDARLLEIIKPYKYVVGVSLQDKDWERDKLFSFLFPCANANKEVLYILIPRKRDDFPELPKNMIVYNEIDCYNIILHCNVHCSLYSSCALEAPTLGIPNILIDINQIASNYYGKLLSSVHTKYITTLEEFFDALRLVVALEKSIIQEENKNIFYNNYSNNIKIFLKKMGIEK